MLHLHRAERADALVAGLATVLATGDADPFASEVVAVPARGVERWLTQRLSHHLGSHEGDGAGVCANVDFPWPSTLVAEAVASAAGVDRESDPWRSGRVLWALLEVVDGCADEPWCSALGRQVAQGRRLVVSRHLSRLFDTYASHRPAMLRDWLAGRDTDGLGAALPDDLVWQAELWRRLRDRIGTPSPAERLEAACTALRDEPGVVDLPGRLSLFGPTRLTGDQVDVLAALSAGRDVHLWLPHPSAVLWDRVSGTAGGRPRRREDPSRHLATHPLLSSLGRDAREVQLLLAGADAVTTDSHHPLGAPPATLLGRLQADLRADQPPAGIPLGDAPDARPLLDDGDRSLQVHAAHGRARQVEVLREVLLGLLADDPGLEPRDVLVMCPDIEAYAPLISATFGLHDDDDTSASHPGHRLRVRLADRSLRQTNPMLATLSRLLELADARVTASQLLDLAALAPVRRRFRFDDDDLEQLRHWVADSGVRWGLDAAHRAPFRMDGVTQNTWQAGLDRILLGAAMSEDELRWIGTALPLDDVDSSDIDLAGRLAELVSRLATAIDRLNSDQPLADWVAALSDSLEALCEVSDRDGWQLSQARRQLADVAEAAAERTDVVLSLADVRALLADRLQGRPTRAGFRTGNLTMCSMVPMRSVPHRVICLLGLDDGAFPRSTGVDGDDVLARNPCVGERDRRSEDRQLLLDAVLAATEHLVVLYTGADERTNAVRPPAVPLGEILDVIDATVRTSDGRPARDHVRVHHPLQPFDGRNFTDGRLGVEGPFSFDTAGLAGARAAVLDRQPAPAFLPGALPPPEPTPVVALDDLVYFLEHPVRAFVRRRLGVLVAEEGDELDEELAPELDGLKKWGVGDRWLVSRLAGADADDCRAAEWRRGELPPGALGQRLLASIETQAEPLVAAISPLRTGQRRAYDTAVTLPDGRVLAGTVGGVHGNKVVRGFYSRLAGKHRLRAWVLLLALAASEPDHIWQAVTVGRGRVGPTKSLLAGPPAHEATAVLADLVSLLDRGMTEPLPLPVQTSGAYADVRRVGDTELAARDAALRRWTGDYGEAKDRYHAKVWGYDADFGVLLRDPAHDDEQAPGHPEPTRFGALACRLWFPLAAAESTDTA